MAVEKESENHSGAIENYPRWVIVSILPFNHLKMEGRRLRKGLAGSFGKGSAKWEEHLGGSSVTRHRI